MKTDEIKDDLSLHKIETKNLNRRVCYNELSIRLVKIYFSVRYPIYNNSILNKIKQYLERAYLLEK